MNTVIQCLRTNRGTTVAPFVLNQVRSLRRFCPIVFTYQGVLDAVGREAYAGIAIYAPYSRPVLQRIVQRATRRLLGCPREFAQAIVVHHPKLLHAHFGPVGVNFLPIARKYGLPMVTSFYGYDISSLVHEHWYGSKLRALFEEADLILVEGRHAKRTVEQLGCSPDRVVVHRLGVDRQVFPYRPRSIDGRGQVKVLVCNSLVEKKGTNDAVSAFATVLIDCPRMTLTIAGDGPLRRELERQVHQLAVSENVRFVGNLTYAEYRNALYQHHILVAPSFTASDGKTEGGAPTILLEAQASGMPVVSTYHADIPNVVREGQTGFLVPERDLDALAGRLQHLVQHPELWPGMGLEGTHFIETQHDLEAQSTELEDLYEYLL